SQPNGTMAMGTASSADLVISMTSCALAAIANQDSAQHTRTAKVFFISNGSFERSPVRTRRHPPGLNINGSSAWNRRGFEGVGKGEALYTAFSTDCRTAASPLQLPILTDSTTPAGVCLTITWHTRSSRADSG